MDIAKIKKIAISSGRHHFLGYWGYGSQSQLEVLLSKVICYECSETSVYGLNKLDSENNLIWNIARIGVKQYIGLEIESNFLDDLDNNPSVFLKGFKRESGETIAAISASGFANSADAWVRLGENNCLILGREPFGRVPLYWMQCGQVIWFASRLQLLLPLIEKPEVNTSGLYGYSCFSYVPTPLTPVEEVFAVPAGTELVWQCRLDEGIIEEPKQRRVLEWGEVREQIKDESVAVSQLRSLLKEGICNQIADLNNEPVGVFLSGGLDSSIVAALLVHAGVKVRAYTLDFGTAGIPEYEYAEQVARFLQIPLVKVPATPRDIKKALINTVEALDLPFGDGVTVPLYLLNQAASQETSIVFNGEGGDQLFAGWTNKPLIAAGVYQAENLSDQKKFIHQYLHTFHRLWGLENQVYQPEVLSEIEKLSPEKWLQEGLDNEYCTSLLHRLRRATLMLKGAQNIHPRATALGFAHNLRVRSLFCDLSLTEWTFQVSGELFLKGACEKYILKKAVEKWLPEEIIWRKKRGMGVPLTSWCLNEFWHEIGTWLNPGTLRQENRFDPEIAKKIVTAKLSATIQGRRIGEILWLLIMWELWRGSVLGEKSDRKSILHPFLLPRWLWRKYKLWEI